MTGTTARRVAIAAAVLAVAVLPPAARAAETTVTFEDLAPGTVVTDQYRDQGGIGQGVTIGKGPGGVTAGAPAKVEDVLPGAAASGTHVVSIEEGAKEFNAYGIWGRFNVGKRLVRVAAGSASAGSSQLSLVGLDSSGSPIPGAVKTVTLAGDGTYKAPLEIQDPQARIVYFKLVQQPNQFPGIYGGIPPPHKIDDLTYDVPEPGAPPPAPDFGLNLDMSQTGGGPLGVSRGHTSNLAAVVHVDRFAGSNGPLNTSVTGLPAGVSADVVVDNIWNPTRYQIRLTATKTATISVGSKFTFTVAPASSASGLQARSVKIPFSVVEDYDLALAGIEVTQGIQKDGALPPRTTKPAAYNGVPLVKRKQTVVRVFPVVAAPAGTKVSGATILLYGARQNDGKLPGSPLHVTAGTIAGGNPDQVSATQRHAKSAATFTLPPSWTTQGTIKLEARVVPPIVLFSGPAECGSSACADDNSYALNGIPFQDTGYLNLAALELQVGGKTTGLPGGPLAAFEQVLPLADGELRRADEWRAEYDVTDIVNATSYQQLFGFCPGLWTKQQCAAAPDLDALLVEYAEDFDPSEEGCGAIFVWQRPSYCYDAVLAMLDDTGIGNPGGLAGLSKGGRTVQLMGARAVANLRRPLTSVAHELGHGLGLKHASAGCKGGANGQKAASWPDAWGTLQGIGYDMRDGHLIYTGNAPLGMNAPPGAPARAWYDFMSYCADVSAEWNAGRQWPWPTANAWISPINWTLLHQSLRSIGRSIASSAAAARARASAFAAAARPTLSVRGFVDGGKVVLARIEPRLGVPTPSTPSPYRLTLRNAAGGAIAQAPMVVESTEGHRRAVDFLTAAVPLAGVRAGALPSALAAVEVSTAAGVQARAVRSAHAPKVRILGPRRGARVGRTRTTTIRWRATDADGGRLTATADYSLDDGRTWGLVWKGPNRGRATVASRLLSGSRRARLRVRVNDGFNETASVSPRFVAVGSPPAVRVMSPRNGQRVHADELLYLSAGATDDRFRRIPDRRIAWYDGRRRIASGAVTSVAGLRPGRHRVRVVARDQRGRQGSASRTVTVLAVAPRLLALSVPRFVSQRARTLRIVIASTLPARVTAAGPSVRGRPHWRIGDRARAIRIPIRPGAGRVTLSLRAAAFGRASTLMVSLPRR